MKKEKYGGIVVMPNFEFKINEDVFCLTIAYIVNFLGIYFMLYKLLI